MTFWRIWIFWTPGTVSIQSGYFSSNSPHSFFLNIDPKLSPRLLKEILSTLLSKTELLSGFYGKPSRAKWPEWPWDHFMFSSNKSLWCVISNSKSMFPENLDFHFLCLNHLFLFGGQIWKAFMFLEYRI